ncbi:MAG TPA: hypothetical protein VJJ76_02105, partial [archaeon]|nr:hypothetical protein [archaeon]
NKFCPAGQSCTNNVCIDLKSDCPDEYDCCVDEADYKDKFCETTDATCTDEHKCAGAGATINYSLIGILAAAIVVGVVLFYFLSGRTSGVTGMKLLDAYEALKRKWRGRLTHLYRKRSK